MLQFNKKLSAGMLFSFSAMFGWAQMSTIPSPNGIAHFVMPASVKTGDYLEKTIILKVKDAYRSVCSNDQINDPKFIQLFTSIGGGNLYKKFPMVTAPEKKTDAQGRAFADLSLIYEFNYTSTVNFEKVINLFNNLGLFEYAEPHFIPHASYTPNDPSITFQYGITKIQAENAWGVNTTTARGDTNVVVGITDTGVELTHPDLVGNIKRNWADPIGGGDNDLDGYIDNFNGWDLGMNDNDPTWQGNEHGVHVSGIAAATTDNATGVAGVGFKCKFLPVKIADNTGALIKAYEGIQYAAAHGCAVINCSWGGGAGGQFQQDIVTYATINNNALVVAASGNDGSNIDFFPASLEYVVSVANTDNGDVAAGSTNYGYSIDVCAPGESIYNTFSGGGYTFLSGTSMASPCAAGAAALIKSFYPSYNALQVGEQLKVTCDNIYPLNTSTYTNKLGKGRINLFNALTVNSSPSIVMHNRVIDDQNDNTFVGNDTLLIFGDHTNYLAPATNVVATLAAIGATGTNVTILDNTTTLGAMGTMGMVSNSADPFRVRIKPTAPLNTLITFRITYTDAATSYSATQYFTVMVNVDYVNITINDVYTSISSTGRIGYRADGQNGGLGFNYMNGGTLLYEAGLMIGTSTSKVSNVVRGTTAGASDTDFMSAVTAHRVVPDVYSEFDVAGTINDNPAATGALPVTVNHKAFAWSTPGNRKYVIVQYVIKNTGGSSLNNLYAGIFADWDIDAATFGSNRASFDAANKMGYAYYSGTAGKYAGIKLLTTSAGVTHYAIDNVSGGGGGVDLNAGGYGVNEKYTTMSTNRTDAGVAGAGADVCDVVSTGPYTIAAGDSIRVAFALIAGDSLLDIQTSAGAAQVMYDGLFPSGIADAVGDDNNSLAVYPNPTAGNAVLEITIAETSAVQLKLYDVTGREVRTIVSERLMAGNHRLAVDMSGFENGIYYYSMELNGKKYVHKMMLMK